MSRLLVWSKAHPLRSVLALVVVSYLTASLVLWISLATKDNPDLGIVLLPVGLVGTCLPILMATWLLFHAAKIRGWPGVWFGSGLYLLVGLTVLPMLDHFSGAKWHETAIISFAWPSFLYLQFGCHLPLIPGCIT